MAFALIRDWAAIGRDNEESGRASIGLAETSWTVVEIRLAASRARDGSILIAVCTETRSIDRMGQEGI